MQTLYISLHWAFFLLEHLSDLFTSFIRYLFALVGLGWVLILATVMIQGPATGEPEFGHLKSSIQVSSPENTKPKTGAILQIPSSVNAGKTFPLSIKGFSKKASYWLTINGNRKLLIKEATSLHALSQPGTYTLSLEADYKGNRKILDSQTLEIRD